LAESFLYCKVIEYKGLAERGETTKRKHVQACIQPSDIPAELQGNHIVFHTFTYSHLTFNSDHDPSAVSYKSYRMYKFYFLFSGQSFFQKL
jgi:hypothetical protein